jgi:hypothetical protein
MIPRHALGAAIVIALIWGHGERPTRYLTSPARPSGSLWRGGPSFAGPPERLVDLWGTKFCRAF